MRNIKWLTTNIKGYSRFMAVDEATNTVYVTNAGSNTVTMLNGRTCNGRVHTGC